MSGILDPPKIIVETFKITRYMYFLSDLISHKSVSYVIHCFDGDVSVKVITGVIEGEEYNQWTSDDWMDAYIKSKIDELTSISCNTI